MNTFVTEVRQTLVPQSEVKHGPLPPLLVAMTLVTGLVDAFSYVVLGHVFVANMTGNVVFLAFALAGVPGFSILASLIALGAFVLGALGGGLLGSRLGQHRGHLLSKAAALQILLLAIAVVLAALSGNSVSPGISYGLIVVLGVAMGLQNATARKLAVPDLTTTVLTLTIVGMVADTRLVGGSGSKAGRRLIAVLAMFVGALVGSLLILHAAIVFPLVLALFVMAVIAAATGLLSRTEPAIGFIGMGHMGSHMASRLIQAGYQLTVYDRTREKAQAIAGASVAETPRDATRRSDVVISIVTDDAALEEVMFGPNGVLAEMHAGSVIIDMSTVSPHASRRLFQAAKEKGVAMLDAAVSGSVPQVEQGSLVIFVGGEQETYQKCRPILDILGHTSFYMGLSGMGTTMKLVVNTLLGLRMQALAEAIALAEKAGLKQEVLLDMLGQTSVLAPGQKAKLDNVRRGQYPTQFALSLQHKDLRLIINEADEVSVPMPVTALTLQMYTAALTRGMDADFSILIEFMKQLAGVS